MMKIHEDCVHIARLLASHGWAPGSSGNLSVRLDTDSILVTPTGTSLGKLRSGDLVQIRLPNGEPIGQGNLGHPTSELPMHLECYRQRSDINAVLHAHPPYIIALSLAGFDFKRKILPETLLSIGRIGLAPYSLPASEDNAHAIRTLLPKCEMIVLSRHGSLTLGKDLYQALHSLEALEAAAQILHLALQLGEVSDLLPEEIARLQKHRERLKKEKSGNHC